jgi:histidinol-phosphate/aromatic aminotransferase/cobyric acid decarboxylase-like protein
LLNKKGTITQELALLKGQAGSHSPSIKTIQKAIPKLNINIDACFLSNPYATEIFMKDLSDVLSDRETIKDIIEYYPSQNSALANIFAEFYGINPSQLIVGNGAIELIEYAMKIFINNKVAITLPTFSPYYESIDSKTSVSYFFLRKTENYQLNLKEFSDFIKRERCDSAILINPGNPTGQYIHYQDVVQFINDNSHLKSIVIDESFIHFAYEDQEYCSMISYYELIKQCPSLILIKSMSKDFGIAGLRVGYMVASEDRISKMLQGGFLWNSNGFAEYFIRKYVEPTFQARYAQARLRHIRETISFGQKLAQLEGFHFVPARSNFFLLEVLNRSSIDVFEYLLVKHGIYVRDCSDKRGLEGNYIRVASRTEKENDRIISGLRKSMAG